MNKIISYFQKTQKKININICKKIINIYKEGDFFDFIEALLKDNKKEVISSYQNLKFQDLNVLVLIATVLTYTFLLKQLIVHHKNKKSFFQIVQLMKKSNFFILKLNSILKNTKNYKINKLIKKMYNLEYHVKTLGWEEKKLLEFFLID